LANIHGIRSIGVNDRNKKAKRPDVRVEKKPGGASNRANGGSGSFRLTLLEIISGDLTGDAPLEDQRSFFPSASVDHLLGS
jgi:hypothetical protein